MKVNVENLKNSHQTFLFLIDAIMMGLIVINLVWIVFDSLFASELIRKGLAFVSPGFVDFYGQHVHPDFVSYDLVFVSIFIVELFVRWGFAIYAKTYHRWFFYPFVHWYDVLGCIPVGSFRWLRLLRVISIVYRLQKFGVIDLRSSAIGRFLAKYYNVVVEEVSDRVVVNVLNGVQDEVRQGSPVIERVLNEVLIPQKAMLANWLTVKINEICDDVYIPNQGPLKDYIDEKIALSLSKDAKVAAVESIPIVGSAIVDVLDQTISDLVFDILDGLIIDLGKQETDHIVQDLLDGIIHKILEPTENFDEASKLLLLDAIEIIKSEVQVQRWRMEASA